MATLFCFIFQKKIKSFLNVVPSRETRSQRNPLGRFFPFYRKEKCSFLSMRLPHSRRGVSAEGFRNIFFYFKEKKMMRRPAEGVFFFRPQLFRHIGPHTNGFISTFIIFLIQNFLQNRLLLFCFFFIFRIFCRHWYGRLGSRWEGSRGSTGVHGGPRGSTIAVKTLSARDVNVC